MDWDTEKNCFLTFSKECATFYSIQKDPFVSHCCSGEMAGLCKESSWQWVTEHIVCPAVSARLVPPLSMAQDGSVLQIANLTELYKVFERC